MEENREPLSAIAIEKKLQLLRNKHFSEDTIALVKSDYEYGLTEEEISLYLNKSYDIEQMKILSECLHKDVPKDVIDIIKNTKYSVHQMQVSLEFYEKGVPVQTIKEVMDKGEKPITMRRLYEEVLEQLNKVKEQIPEESEYVKALISQMDEVVAKINHQNERYDALNKKLSEIETSKDDEEVRGRLVKENQDKDALMEQFTGKHYPAGDFLDQSGKVVGTHSGAVRYTLGQRKGLGLALGAPVYVCGKDMQANTVTVGPESELFDRIVYAEDVNWIAIPALTGPLRVTARTRYHQAEQQATVYPSENGFRLEFDQPQRAPTPGQAAVLYQGDVVLGGGTITRVEK